MRAHSGRGLNAIDTGKKGPIEGVQVDSRSQRRPWMSLNYCSRGDNSRMGMGDYTVEERSDSEWKQQGSCVRLQQADSCLRWRQMMSQLLTSFVVSDSSKGKVEG